MIRRATLFATLLSLSIATLVWADKARRYEPSPEVREARENLRTQRENYQHSVAAQGPRSPEARQARENLRAARRSYFNKRRQDSGGPRR